VSINNYHFQDRTFQDAILQESTSGIDTQFIKIPGVVNKNKHFLHSILSTFCFFLLCNSSLVILVPSIVSQCTKNGCEKFDLIPIAYNTHTFNQHRNPDTARQNTYLMMNIMIISIIPKKYLQRIPRQTIPAVIIHRLTHRHEKQDHRLSRGHPRYPLCQNSACRIQQKPLHRMIIQRAKSIWNI